MYYYEANIIIISLSLLITNYQCHCYMCLGVYVCADMCMVCVCLCVYICEGLIVCIVS